MENLSPILLSELIQRVQTALENAEGGHDWFHIERVWKMSRQICLSEGGNPVIVELAALLHDIADSKFHNGNEELGVQKAQQIMRDLLFPEDIVASVSHIIANMSFRKEVGGAQKLSLEGQIVQDADRLDAIGAVGIARAFNYGGYKNRKLYDPTIPPVKLLSTEQYKSLSSPTINHFYEKLLLLKDRMQTNTGKALAEQRHQFMQDYLNQFFLEWEGKK